MKVIYTNWLGENKCVYAKDWTHALQLAWSVYRVQAFIEELWYPFELLTS